MTSGFASRQRELRVTMKRFASSSSITFISQPSVRVTLSSATFCRLASRYSSCSAICSTVLARRSLKNGDSLPAHSLHRFPSSSLRLPRSPISPPQMLQVFFSNIFPNSPMSRPFRRLQLRTPIMAEAGKAKKRPAARKGAQKRTERLRLPFRRPKKLALCVGGFGRVRGKGCAKAQQGGASSCAVRLARITWTGHAKAGACSTTRWRPNSCSWAAYSSDCSVLRPMPGMMRPLETACTARRRMLS